MKAARLVVLGIAVAAGGLAALLVSGGEKTPPQAPTPQLATTDVLVAKRDIPIGHAVSAQDIEWQAWPAATTSAATIRKGEKPNAISELEGAVARVPFLAGEPVREAKLIKGTGGGYMAAVLPAGMRAVSTEISPETGAGGFILPNDHVDVILARRNNADKATNDTPASETILTNVRVLAIDQTVEEKNGEKVVIGKTATLELAPGQAETLAIARQLGVLSLALRSLVDSGGNKAAENDGRRSSINVVRFGITSTTQAK